LDLVAIGRYIAHDRPQAARRFVERLRERARGAAQVPRAGRVVPEFRRDSVREVFEGNYRIVYLIERRRILVLTVFEGHRLLSPNRVAIFESDEGRAK
jgi:plasmid stabilization system protein ParE